jgi:S1-C subfamily serine protease
MIRTGTSLIVAFLLFLAGLNIAQRWSWRELEDGVLWKNAGGDIVAAEIASGTAAERAGLHRGDVLLAIDGRPVDRVEDVVATLHDARHGQPLR